MINTIRNSKKQGNGLYLNPRTGKRLYLNLRSGKGLKKDKKLIFMLPNRPFTTKDIIKYVKLFKINHFRGVFSRDNLPKKPYIIECAIINLDSASGDGTHWLAYYKNKNEIIYFDSFGNFPPSIKLQKYFKGFNIQFNYYNYQNYNTFICGHLCIEFLLCTNPLH